MMPQDLLIFNHIPKTAGTSLKQIITEQYGSENCFLCYGGVFGNQTIADRVEELNKQLVYEDNQGKKNKTIKAVIGHVGYGLHDLLPDRQFTHITFLRNPVERVISYYYDLNRQGRVGTPTGNQSRYIIECIETKFLIEADNWQTRYLSGRGWQHIILKGKGERIGFGQCTTELLEQAKKELKENYLFGIQDRFIESINFFTKKLDWQPASQNIKLNSAQKNQNKKHISAEAIECIKKLNWLDMELYEYAKGILEEQINNKNLVA